MFTQKIQTNKKTLRQKIDQEKTINKTIIGTNYVIRKKDLNNTKR